MRSYLQIASGLTEMTRQRVTEVAKALVERSGLDLEQVPDQAQALPQYVQQVAEELYETGKANRDLLVGVVRGEVDKALSRSKPWTKDLVKAEEEIARLKSRVTDLEHRLARASTPRTARPAAGPGAGAGSAGRPATPPAASRAGAPADAPIARPAVDAEAPAAKKAAAKPPAAKKAAAKKTPASRPAAASTPAAAARKPARKTNGTAATKKAAPAKKAIRKPTAPTADADGQS
ncbi:histone [Embleya sp. NPDC050493]|uniref:histone n=1 Tax=Embleya sp. NPDC050493 TaxID=3363989 RepID=UPI0037A602B1